jgi:hypothetical protein
MALAPRGEVAGVGKDTGDGDEVDVVEQDVVEDGGGKLSRQILARPAIVEQDATEDGDGRDPFCHPYWKRQVLGD